MNPTLKAFRVGLILALFARVAVADELIATNGERFIGRIIEETTNSVVFKSEIGGKFTLPRSRVRELVRTSPDVDQLAPGSGTASTNAPGQPATTRVPWRPPGVGTDKADWIQLKSGEWLRGEFKYIQQKKVEFDSDEMDELTLNLKDVRKAFPREPMYTMFEGRQPVFGHVVLSNDLVIVSGDEPLALSRDLLTGITPGGGITGMRSWSGKVTLSLSLQSGNKDQTTLTTSAQIARRTPNTRLELDYLGNYNEANGDKNADNDRVNLTHDIRLNKDWFVRPVQFEYYRDPLANIAYRLTGGVGAGYYIFDEDEIEWRVSVGPAYQYTGFDTVEAGNSDSASTPAGVFNLYFKSDITKRLTFYQTLASMVTDREAGQYSHHAITTLEFEIKRHLDLDVSFIWDYLHDPQPKSDGTIPAKSDYYLTVGVGVRF
jgi:putative salt-induced outer membrane protein YdiY